MSGVVAIVVPIIAFFFLGNLITSIVFTYNYKTYDGIDETISEIMKNGLNANLIYSFRSSDTCSSDEEALVLGTFDGSVPKCKCVSIYNRSCTNEEINYQGCKSYSGAKKDYTKFKNKNICAKKKDYYKDLLKNKQIIPKGNNCDERYRSCGIIDTLDNQLCIKNEEECPINKADIINLRNMNEEQLEKYKNYKSIDMGNGYAMYYLNEGNENNKIISIIKLSEGYPCINPGEHVWKSYDPDSKNKLEKCTNYKGKNRDDRYERLDNYYSTKRQILIDNDLEGYNNALINDDLTDIYLYGGPIFGLKKEIENIDIKEIKDTQEYLNKYNDILGITRTVVYWIVGAPLVCLGGLGGLGAEAEGCDGDCALFALAWLGGCLVIAGGLGNFCIFIYCIIILANHIQLKSMISPLTDSTDIYTMEVINSLLKDNSSNVSFSIAIIVLTALSFLVICSGGFALICLQ